MGLLFYCQLAAPKTCLLVFLPGIAEIGAGTSPPLSHYFITPTVAPHRKPIQFEGQFLQQRRCDPNVFWFALLCGQDISCCAGFGLQDSLLSNRLCAKQKTVLAVVL